MFLPRYQQLVKKLKNKRKKIGLKQKTLAESIGISPSMLSRIEKGDRKARYTTIRKIYQALQEKDRNRKTAQDLMNHNIQSLKPTDTCKKARNIMKNKHYSQIPIIKDEKQVGKIEEHHLIEAEDDNKIKKNMDKQGFPEIGPKTPRSAVQELLEDNKAVLVKGEDGYEGIITNADMME
ncbi:MAG: helix-turn-helix domain-containing protein [Candidatus Nanohaloarchaea archaeon]|nr:helix-turn-helix domain-containing protein [Candidatus Nanohaloarchaea archaeon]